MGKPFQNELQNIHQTHKWALQQDTDWMQSSLLENSKLPHFIVGSGGSLSACFFAVALFQKLGIVAKAVTPLDLIYSKEVIKNSCILFITASGNNSDILFSYKIAQKQEPYRLYSICMTMNSPLKKLSLKYANNFFWEYNLPTGKDGFLATNSLVAFFTILNKALTLQGNKTSDLTIKAEFQQKLNHFITRIDSTFTFTVLYAGLGQSVAIDIESKLAEAALSDVLLSDYRNFGHGRHHWFAKRAASSAVIALITPDEKSLATKTLSLLPKNIPVLVIESKAKFSYASIELLVKSFEFVNRLGKVQGIDPGKPGVPSFGSKLYRLNYHRFYESKGLGKTSNIRAAISRKVNAASVHNLSKDDEKYWTLAYRKFVIDIQKARFGSIVFDYDGTLCSAERRYVGIDTELVNQLKNILSIGVVIGIATGRGKSVRTDLQNAIPKKYWNQIIIGYYNCSDIGLLEDDSIPNKNAETVAVIQSVFNRIQGQKFLRKIKPELKPCQITIEIQDKKEWPNVRTNLVEFILSLNQSDIQVLESTHSMDVISMSRCNKLNIIDRCTSMASSRGLEESCLCIGDKGKWPGNDYQLLSSRYSLSVDEVSSLSDSCWNLAPLNVKNVKATSYYISCLSFDKKGLKLTIK